MASIYAILGKNIRTLRKSRGWSQANLAEKAGISASFMTMVELGQRGVSLGLVEDMASIFEVPVSFLFMEHTEHIEEIAQNSSGQYRDFRVQELQMRLKKKIDEYISQAFDEYTNSATLCQKSSKNQS